MKASKTVIGILAHVDAGKTTLSEGLLYTAGVLRKLGRVDHRDAFLDNFALERERGITIFSKQANFRRKRRGRCRFWITVCWWSAALTAYRGIRKPFGDC